MINADNNSKIEDYGDEPILLSSRLRNIPIAVGANKYNAALQLIKKNEVDRGINIIDIVIKSNLLKSKSEVRRAIKNLGISSRKRIEGFIKKKVLLSLTVKVKKDWRSDDQQLRYFGYLKK